MHGDIWSPRSAVYLCECQLNANFVCLAGIPETCIIGQAGSNSTWAAYLIFRHDVEKGVLFNIEAESRCVAASSRQGLDLHADFEQNTVYFFEIELHAFYTHLKNAYSN